MSVKLYFNGKLRTGNFHDNGGGFVEETAFVSKSVYLGPMCKVIDQAIVGDTAQAAGIAGILSPGFLTDANQIVDLFQAMQIIQGAGINQVIDSIQLGLELFQSIFGSGQSQTTTEITGQVVISDQSMVIGMCKLKEHVQIKDQAQILDTGSTTTLSGYVVVKDKARVQDSVLSGSVVVRGNTYINGQTYDYYSSNPCDKGCSTSNNPYPG